jgi:hypothetical protein
MPATHFWEQTGCPIWSMLFVHTPLLHSVEVSLAVTHAAPNVRAAGPASGAGALVSPGHPARMKAQMMTRRFMPRRYRGAGVRVAAQDGLEPICRLRSITCGNTRGLRSSACDPSRRPNHPYGHGRRIQDDVDIDDGGEAVTSVLESRRQLVRNPPPRVIDGDPRPPMRSFGGAARGSRWAASSSRPRCRDDRPGRSPSDRHFGRRGAPFPRWPKPLSEGAGCDRRRGLRDRSRCDGRAGRTQLREVVTAVIRVLPMSA